MLFDRLRETMRRKAALVETPVAFIQWPNGTGTILTLWKKGTRPLIHFVANRRISRARRRSACFSAVRQITKLHAAGFSHGHLNLGNREKGQWYNPGNLLVTQKGDAWLVDYALLQRKIPDEKHESNHMLFYTLAQALHWYRIDKLDELARFRGELWREYEKTRNEYEARRRRKKT